MNLRNNRTKFFIQLLTGVITIFSCFSCTAQHGKMKKLLKQAERNFEEGNLKSALTYYKRLYRIDSTNYDYNFKIGFCYLNSPNQKIKSIPFFEKASIRKDTIPETFYYLGQAYHLNNQFDMAINAYKNFKLFIKTTTEGQKLNMDVERRIAMCNNGKILIQDPVQVIITNLGEAINSEYQDYAPVVSNDELTLFFTSRRKGSTDGLYDSDGEFYEDIYISKNESTKNINNLKDQEHDNAQFSKARNLGSKINTSSHDAAIGISSNSDRLFICRDKDIYESNLPKEGDKWEKPKKLNENINSKKREPGISLSSDEDIIYFVSDRKGGYGGTDIYRSKILGNGQWALAENLGPFINTAYDEDAPFISQDGKTLYFSSKGHSSMGEFDIFKSAYENGNWSIPENLGYPINSSADDIYYYQVPGNTERAYFSSTRDSGIGDMDIYRINTTGTGNRIIIIKGVVLDDSLSPLTAKITVTEKKTNLKIGEYKNNTLTGKYLIIFKAGKHYTFDFEAKGYQSQSADIYIPNARNNYEFYQEIILNPVRNSSSKKIGQKLIIKNAFFDINKVIDTIPQYSTLKDRYKAYQSYLKNLDKTNNPFFHELIKTVFYDSVDIEKFQAYEEEYSHTSYKELKNKSDRISQSMYFVQVGAFKTAVPIDYYSNIEGIQTVNADTLVKYIVGGYLTREPAEKLKNKMVQMGYTDAFVVFIESDEPDYTDIYSESSEQDALYKIQVGAFQQGIPLDLIDIFLQIDDLSNQKGQDGFTRYYAGSLKNRTQAEKLLKEIKKKGIKDAFITTTPLTNNALTIDKITSNKNTKIFSSKKVKFKVQIGAFKDIVPIDIASIYLSLENMDIETSNDTTIYTSGLFYDYESADKHKKVLTDKGIPGAFIIAYYKDKKIPVQQAIELLKQ